MSPIYVWRYTLRSASALNAASGRKEHDGALIRASDGYGCLHPWPELGDATLEEQIGALGSGLVTPLIRQAMRCAAEDGKARREGRSLFAGPVPESHWLALPGDDPLAALALGFNRVKLKIGRDTGAERKLAGKWGEVGFRLRFDGNESLSPADFLRFWDSLGELRDQVELVEDPIAWRSDRWGVLRDAGVPLAVDRNADTRAGEGDIVVVKPALSDRIPPGPSPFLITSYMDHALGQLWAAAEASRFLSGPEGGRMLACGLMTHRCFEPDPFSEQLRCEGARLVPPPGAGLGFDTLLEGLPWKRLT